MWVRLPPPAPWIQRVGGGRGGTNRGRSERRPAIEAAAINPSLRRDLIFLVCGRNCSTWVERSLGSLREQRDPEFRAVVIDDCSTDDTAERMRAAVGNDPRFRLAANPSRRFGLGSRRRAAELAEARDDDVFVVLDADDWLAGGDVVARVKRVFADPGVWLSYGNHCYYKPERLFRKLSPRPRIVEPYPQPVLENSLVRLSPWRGSHLRAFRAFLYRAIPEGELVGPDGKPLTSCEDMATMFPMLELAGPEHVRFVPEVLYVYNKHANILNRTNREEQELTERRLRARPTCARLRRDA